jgi:hypothetical protein
MTAKEMSDKIEETIRSVLPEAADYEEGDFLVDWVLVTYVSNPDEEKASGYPMLVSNGELAYYRVLGLLNIGIDKLKPSVE